MSFMMVFRTAQSYSRYWEPQPHRAASRRIVAQISGGEIMTKPHSLVVLSLNVLMSLISVDQEPLE